LGDDVSIWFNSVVRGDCHLIRVGARTNIQDNCVIHVTQETYPCVLEEEVTLGHAAIVHGATVKRGALIGIRATVLDGAQIGESAFIGAGALVTPRTVVPPRTLWLGAPAYPNRVESYPEWVGGGSGNAGGVRGVWRTRCFRIRSSGYWRCYSVNLTAAFTPRS
jgi:carbonic anhydrase/acetyltransferase-like protein (isoleucine patch superfamily)